MPLLIGPLLRRVSGSRATIWVETSAPATVEVRATPAGGVARTFTAFGHHYALVVVEGLPPASATPYEVYVDGVKQWPPAGSPYPPSVIRTRPPEAPVRLVFGSCREATTKTGYPPDALDAYASRLARADHPLRDWPDCLVLLGDQVYADETSPRVRRWLTRRRRTREAPVDQVVTFEEYTQLYAESWSDPELRWLLSTVPSVMIFDDHEIIDDWNTSDRWRADMRAKPWWPRRMAGGLSSYWVYQHLGNIAPEDLDADPLYAKVTGVEDASDVLRDFAERVEREPDVGHDPLRWQLAEYRWSFALDIGNTRLVVLDTRASRVLDPANRAMLPAGEWQWFLDRLPGGYDHLVLGTSLPWLLAPGVHFLEAWNERLCLSRRTLVARWSEWLRRALDLEHWAAFGRSFEELTAVLGQVSEGIAGSTPASVSVLSGDVHHSYVARADLGPGPGSPVHQLTCSPIHNQLPAPMRPFLRVGWGGPVTAATRALARSAGLPRPTVRWRKLAGPYFGNAISTLVHSGRSAYATIEGTRPDGSLHRVAGLPLTPDGS